jgi:hypothetical protein
MKKIWNKIKHWCCKVGLCNLNKCGCDCHDKPKGRSKAYYPTPTAKTVLPPLPEAKEKLKADGTPDKRFRVSKKDPCSAGRT